MKVEMASASQSNQQKPGPGNTENRAPAPVERRKNKIIVQEG